MNFAQALAAVLAVWLACNLAAWLIARALRKSRQARADRAAER